MARGIGSGGANGWASGFAPTPQRLQALPRLGLVPAKSRGRRGSSCFAKASQDRASAALALRVVSALRVTTPCPYGLSPARRSLRGAAPCAEPRRLLFGASLRLLPPFSAKAEG